MTWLLKFFQDKDGKPSAMRMMSFLSLLASIWFTHLAFTLPAGAAILPFSIHLITLFVVGAFAPKAIQKFAENQK